MLGGSAELLGVELGGNAEVPGVVPGGCAEGLEDAGAVVEIAVEVDWILVVVLTTGVVALPKHCPDRR